MSFSPDHSAQERCAGRPRIALWCKGELIVTYTPQYFLPPSSFYCLTDRYCVFLDLKKDRYLSVSRRNMDALLASVAHHSPDGAAASRGSVSGVSCFAEQLLERGLLTTSPNSGRPLMPVAIPTPTSTLLDARESGRRDPRQIVRLFASAYRAHRRLQREPLESTVQSAIQRKVRGDHTAFDPARTRDLTSTFHQLRLWFPRRSVCLFDSLALLEFLAAYDTYPQWVFGVQAEPFEAHCWLQQDTVVLNDTLEHVSLFTPIMII